MKIDIKGILEGAYNSLIVKKEVEKIADERIAICRECIFNSENAKLKGYKTSRPDEHCVDCGCNLHMKTRCLSCQCPQKLWGEVITPDQDNLLQEKLKDA